MLKKSVVFWIICFFCCSFSLEAKEKPSLLNLPTLGPKKYQDSSDYLNTALSKHIGKMQKFQLISDLYENPNNKDSLGFETCKDDSCVLEIGGSMGADFVLRSQLKLLGSSFVVSCTLFEIENSKIVLSEQLSQPKKLIKTSASLDQISLKIAQKVSGLSNSELESYLNNQNEGLPTWVWWAGGAVVVGAAVLSIALLSSEEETKVNDEGFKRY